MVTSLTYSWKKMSSVRFFVCINVGFFVSVSDISFVSKSKNLPFQACPSECWDSFESSHSKLPEPRKLVAISGHESLSIHGLRLSPHIDYRIEPVRTTRISEVWERNKSVLEFYPKIHPKFYLEFYPLRTYPTASNVFPGAASSKTALTIP